MPCIAIVSVKIILSDLIREMEFIIVTLPFHVKKEVSLVLVLLFYIHKKEKKKKEKPRQVNPK